MKVKENELNMFFIQIVLELPHKCRVGTASTELVDLIRAVN